MIFGIIITIIIFTEVWNMVMVSSAGYTNPILRVQEPL